MNINNALQWHSKFSQDCSNKIPTISELWLNMASNKMAEETGYRHFETRQFEMRHFDTDNSIRDSSRHDISIRGQFDTCFGIIFCKITIACTIMNKIQ